MSSSDVSRIEEAARAYVRRKVGFDNPPGYYERGLWFPYNDERRACCDQIKQPNSLRQSLLRHCRTAVHVSQLYQVDERELRRQAKELV